MEAAQRRKLDKFQREETFLSDNAADFPAAAPGGKASAEQSAIIAEIETLAAQQVSGADTLRQEIGVKADHLEELTAMIRNINRAANAFSDEVAGSGMKFRLPRKRSQQNLLATAKSFLADAAPLEAKFIEYGLPAGFLAEMQDTINHIETRGTNADSAIGQQSAATGGMADAVRRGMEVSRKLDAIVRIFYRDNPAKLAAWTVASHLERAPQTSTEKQQRRPSYKMLGFMFNLSSE